MDDRQTSGAMPDAYDRLLGALDGLPGSLQTKPTTLQVVTLLGAETWIVRTVRQQDRSTDADGKETAGPAQFTVFIEYHGRADQHVRLPIPPRVADLIARQRDSLTGQARTQTARRAAADRKRRGIVPGFLRAGRGKTKRS